MYKSLIISENPLDRVKLLMNYDLSATKTENVMRIFEQDVLLPAESGISGISAGEVATNYDIITTPERNGMYVPKGTQILQKADQEYYLELLTSSSLKNWVSKKRGGLGDSITDAWIPDITGWSKIAVPDSVVSFKTPDGLKYNAIFKSSELEKIKSFEELRSKEPNPQSFKFVGYYTRDNKKYIPFNTKGSYSTPVLDWIVDNWEIIAQVAASIAVGIATGGQSLWIQALAQFGVDVTFAAKQFFINKDTPGAVISLIMGLIPLSGRALKYGVKDVNKFLKTYGLQLSKVDNLVSFKKFWETLDPPNQLLLYRALKQTPAELKKMTSIATANVFKEAIEKGTIQVQKIPLKNLLWIKEVFVEGGISLTTGVGLTILNQIRELKQTFDKDTKVNINTGLSPDYLDSLSRDMNIENKTINQQ